MPSHYLFIYFYTLIHFPSLFFCKEESLVMQVVGQLLLTAKKIMKLVHLSCFLRGKGRREGTQVMQSQSWVTSHSLGCSASACWGPEQLWANHCHQPSEEKQPAAKYRKHNPAPGGNLTQPDSILGRQSHPSRNETCRRGLEVRGKLSHNQFPISSPCSSLN